MQDLENEFLYRMNSFIGIYSEGKTRREGEMRSIFFSNRGKYVRDLDLRCRTIDKLFQFFNIRSKRVPWIYF